MNNKIILILSILWIITLSSCGDQFLEKFPHNPTSGDFYKYENGVKEASIGVYNSLYFISLEGFYQVPIFVCLDNFTGLCYPREENVSISAGGLTTTKTEVLDFWKNWYLTIARANSLIGEADPNQSYKIKQYVAEAKVLRALAYYMLITTYGDVVFFTTSLKEDEYKLPRTSKVKIMNFILDELEEAGEVLPDFANLERGRVGKDAAYALKARAALAAGSFNFDGKAEYYFRISAEAAAKVIGKRGLAKNFDDLFTTYGQKKGDVSNELIWELMFGAGTTVKSHWAAYGQVSRFYGQTARHPSQRLFDTYECIDGKRIDESPLYNPNNPKKNRDPRLHSTIWMHGDTVCGNTNGTSEGRIKVILNANRTPLGSEVGNTESPRSPQARYYNYSTGRWEWRNNIDFTDGTGTSFASSKGVGYMWRKFSNDTIESVHSSIIHIPIIRYAEVLLTYAEAKIELGEYAKDSVSNAINELRARSNMPAIDPSRRGSQDKMRQIVRRERKVELINEGLHFVDMRRWNIGDLENDGPSYGIPKEEYRVGGNIERPIPNFKKNERYDLNDIASYDNYKDKLMERDVFRHWNPKFNLWPIPQKERELDPNLTQNEGY